MSFPAQFGLGPPTVPPSSLGPTQLLIPASSTSSTHVTSSSSSSSSSTGAPGGASAGGGTGCCDNGRPILTDPHTGQTICSCQYPPGAAGLLAAYPRVYPGLNPETMYPSPYATAQTLMMGGDPTSAFYPPLGGMQTSGAFPYDGTLSAYHYSNGFMDPNARRKNATRESTNTLKAWLNEHRKNPYPTKGEKIMLAIITKMTLTQVSTWFANARRRLKKENKMTWSPRNRCGEDGEDDDEDGDVGRRGSDADSLPGEGHRDRDDDEDELLDVDSDMVDVDCDVTDIPLTSAGHDLSHSLSRDQKPTDLSLTAPSGELNGTRSPGHRSPSPNMIPTATSTPRPHLSMTSRYESDVTTRHSHLTNDVTRHGHLTTDSRHTSPPGGTTGTPPSVKPKIWSLADVASSSSSSDNDVSKDSPKGAFSAPVSRTLNMVSPSVGLWPTYGLHSGLHAAHMDPRAALHAGMLGGSPSAGVIARLQGLASLAAAQKLPPPPPPHHMHHMHHQPRVLAPTPQPNR